MESERKQLISDMKGMFDRDSNRTIFKKFIEYIRFPFFKNFEKDLKVNFNFPITFIVGQNGSGKSSLLHALYGAPRNYSIATYWFDTALDPIEYIKTNRHCFIYSYFAEYSRKNVEVIKLRIQVRDKKTGKINLDYWEPSRPYKKYFMIRPQESDDKRDTSPTKDRWNPITKSVYHMDFRYSLSAYDKYFYFGSKPNTKTLKSKQDVIRKYASKLKKAFDDNADIYFRTRKVIKPITITVSEIEEIRYILGKDYTETKITTHNIYDKRMGFAVRFKTDKITYSEAYAGSGETAIVKLVHDLYSAEDYSLVLLDEPETSLHPLAQKRLINFILNQIKKKKLQVIISTHSPDIIEGMPPEAIKILYENPDTRKIGIIENVYPENAFVHIGRTVTDKKIILTEDKLAKMIIDAILQKNYDTELFDVVYHPGGVSQIKQKEITVYSKEDNSKHFIILDGDQQKEKIDITELSDREKNPLTLKSKIKDLVGEEIKFSFDSNATNQQKKDIMLKYIKYHFNHVFFLPKNIPEEIIWNDDLVTNSDFTDEEKEQINAESSYKKKFALYALAEYGSNSADDLEKIHKKFIKRWIDKKNEDYQSIDNILKQIKA